MTRKAINYGTELYQLHPAREAVEQMVANNRQTRRYSGLRARLAEEH